MSSPIIFHFGNRKFQSIITVIQPIFVAFRRYKKWKKINPIFSFLIYSLYPITCIYVNESEGSSTDQLECRREIHPKSVSDSKLMASKNLACDFVVLSLICTEIKKDAKMWRKELSRERWVMRTVCSAKGTKV